MGRFGQWLGLTHTQRYNAHYHTTGEGHLYQGRYKSFPIQSDGHFLSVCRYVERNAYSADLCAAPDLWHYGSLYCWRHGTQKEKALLTKWPIPCARWLGRLGRACLVGQGAKAIATVHATRSPIRRRNVGRINCTPPWHRINPEAQRTTKESAHLAKTVPDTFVPFQGP